MPFGFLTLTLAALLLMASCARQSAEPEKQSVMAPVTGPASPGGLSEYAGNDACAGCHQKEFDKHHGSRHAMTLRPMNRESIGAQAPPSGSVPGTNYVMEALGERFVFGLTGGQRFPLDLAFGSGKTGMAFTKAIDKDTMAEARISWYPPGKKFYITPGMESMPENSMGNVTRGPAARQCLECHTIAVPVDSLMPERMFMGVGCEACHGPGRAHADARKAGDFRRGRMEKLGEIGGQKLVERCGRCHRTEKDVAEKNLPAGHTDLFQSYGLVQSRCFKESSDKLSCITCHDPHTDVSADEKGYEAVCQQCHTGPDSIVHPQRPLLVRAKLCPVNKTDKCIECHMPKRAKPVFPGSPRRVADHFIRVNSASR